MLRAERLVKVYGRRRVVDGLDLTVNAGEVVGLLGPNGAGKTTTFSMIVGAVRPAAGKVFLQQKEITKLPLYLRARRGIGFLPQEASVFRKLTVEQNLDLVLEFQPLPRAERKERREELLASFNLAERRRSLGYQLSGGERRRVEIARALCTRPKIMLLDEPFTGIDPIAIEDIQEAVIKLKEASLGVLVTDHNVRETLRIVDRAYILHEGAILVCGSREEVAKSPVARKYYLGEKFSL